MLVKIYFEQVQKHILNFPERWNYKVELIIIKL